MGVPVALILAGGAMQAASAVQQSKAAENAAKINEKRAAEEAADQQRELYQKMRRIAGENRTIIAKSGVRMEGSPNAILAANEMKLMRNQYMIQRRSKMEQLQYRNQARFARYAGGIGATSALISSAGVGLMSRDNPVAASLLGTT